MKKFLLTGTALAFLAVITSCGHTGCDAYGGHKSDFTKYKAEKQNTIQLEKAIFNSMKK